jgi:hypothetical protein
MRPDVHRAINSNMFTPFFMPCVAEASAVREAKPSRGGPASRIFSLSANMKLNYTIDRADQSQAGRKENPKNLFSRARDRRGVQHFLLRPVLSFNV